MKILHSRVEALVCRFESIYREKMEHLPITNRRLRVEAVGFRRCGDYQLGVLITPWFINLILLPESAIVGDHPQGSKSTVTFACGNVEFTGCDDPRLGQYRSAALFRSVTDFPSQAVASDIANQVLKNQYTANDDTPSLTRRAVLTGRGLV
jgi:[NiFe] hydrogenase assembly HybE family chaperone